MPDQDKDAIRRLSETMREDREAYDGPREAHPELEEDLLFYSLPIGDVPDHITAKVNTFCLHCLKMAFIQQDENLTAGWSEELCNYLREIREVPSGLNEVGLKIKGDIAVERRSYSVFTVPANLSSLVTNVRVNYSARIPEEVLGKLEKHNHVANALREKLGAFMGKCVDLILENPFPKPLNIKPLVPGFLRECRAAMGLPPLAPRPPRPMKSNDGRRAGPR